MDTLKIYENLKLSGMPELQAKAVVEGINGVSIENAASKDDTSGIKEELQITKSELKQDISDLRMEVKEEINNLRTEVKQDIGDLRVELEDLRVEFKEDISSVRSEMRDGFHNQLKWIIGLAIAQVGIIISMKF